MHMKMCDLVNKIPRGKKRKIIQDTIEERKRARMDVERIQVNSDFSEVNTDGDESDSDISILNNSEIHEISIDEEQENEEDNRVMSSEGGSSVVRILNLKEWLKNPWMPV